ncbi:MAG TPA: phage holin family protein [Acidimicrobiia bacterium]|nr:phage holin family protein [Acidimicrobiia bacterium]HKN91121.1 phage holin family protein [Acidimicrobiia bacterium]HTC81788.1 phage holin family protein [Acidimicrobiia bacterium]
MVKEAKPKAKNPSGDARELVDLVIAYAKQETLEPLKGLGKNAALGLGGAVLLGLGGVFCSLGALRAMQSETDFFERHNLSYLPYFLAILILAVLSVIGWVGLGPGKKDK